MYIYIFAYIHVFTRHICTKLHNYMFIRTIIYIHIYIYMCVYMYIHIQIHMHINNICKYTCAHVCISLGFGCAEKIHIQCPNIYIYVSWCTHTFFIFISTVGVGKVPTPTSSLAQEARTTFLLS